jgi:hypothetical protein
VAAGDKVVSGPYRTLRDLEDGDAVKIEDEEHAEAEPEADDGNQEASDEE